MISLNMRNYNSRHLGNVFDVNPNGDKGGSGHVWQVVPGRFFPLRVLQNNVNVKIESKREE